jgi:hypothetical protein
MAYNLFSLGGDLLQEDIHLRELEDEHWLCNAGADRHVRQVSDSSLVPAERETAVNEEV